MDLRTVNTYGGSLFRVAAFFVFSGKEPRGKWQIAIHSKYTKCATLVHFAEHKKNACKMRLMRAILSNGYMAIFPILVWNISLTSKLPDAFHPESFNSDIPLTILIGENIFRTAIFLMPILFRLNMASSTNLKGVVAYLLGVVLYFSSWLALVYAPDSTWSNSLLGFAAPSYTPLIWLIGLSMMVNSYYLKIAYSKWHFILPSIAFSIFHVSHTVYVFSRSY